MRRPAILFLNDGSLLLDLIGNWLESQGWCVRLTNTAQEAKAELAKIAFDLVILKLTKEQPHRLEVLKRLGRETQLIILSEEKQLPVVAYQVEVADYIFFPCRWSEIRRRIFFVLERLKNRPPSQTRTQLNSINQRVYNKLALYFLGLEWTLQSRALIMRDLHHKIKDTGDQQLRSVCQDAYNDSVELLAIINDFRDSFKI